MQKHTSEEAAVAIGIDLGDKLSQWCTMVEVDRKFEVVDDGSFATTRKGVERIFGGRPSVRIAIEVGTHSPWVSRQLEDLGHVVVVANPRKTQLIAQSDRKSDRVDAWVLARLALAGDDLLYPIQHRGPQAQLDLALVRSRYGLIRSRTLLINHVRGAVKSVGSRLPSCSSASFHKKIEAELPRELYAQLHPLVEVVGSTTEQIQHLDYLIENVVLERYPEASRLRQVVGVGPVTALTFILTIEDPKRFPRSRDVGSYLGLRPRQSDSGNSAPQLRITKAGDGYLRQLLVGCGQYILGPFGPDCDLRRFGLKLAERGGKNAKKRAVVAVARKLAVLLHALWVSGASYQPLRANERSKTAKPSAGA